MARANEGNMHYEYYNQNMTKDEREDYRYTKALDERKTLAKPEVVFFNGKRYLKVPPESVGEESGTFLVPYPHSKNTSGKRKKKKNNNR